MLSAPTDVQRRMKNYCGSVVFSHDGRHFAVSSPRGGIVTYWSSNGDYLGHHEQADACGLANSPADAFLISDGHGQIARINRQLADNGKQAFADTRWDNHMLALSGEF